MSQFIELTRIYPSVTGRGYANLLVKPNEIISIADSGSGITTDITLSNGVEYNVKETALEIKKAIDNFLNPVGETLT
jgi:uncharacterized protein YlzI (FlbEa/FlbD family)